MSSEDNEASAQQKPLTRHHVLIIHNILWSHYKAAVFSQLAKLGPSHGFEVSVVHLAESEKQRRGLGAIDLALHDYPHTVLFKEALDEVGIFSKLRAVRRALMHERYDIVVISGYHDPSYWLALLIARLRGARVIVSIDSTVFDRRRRKTTEAIKRCFTHFCDAAYGYGTRSLDYCQSLGFRPDQVFIRCQATDGATIERRNKEAKSQVGAIRAKYGLAPHNFIYVGRLSAEKNVATALRAFKKALVSLPRQEQWGFVVVGSGPELAHLEQVCLEAQIPNVAFVGSFDWREVTTFYAASDILVLPSTSEPWGLVVNEAMECELPILVSDACGAAPDLVREGENGYKFAPHDEERLAELMAELMADLGRLRSMGLRSKEIIAASTPRNAALQMIEGLRYVSRTHV
jgi:glycosyltransferase involved in cell wall biosynthesis